MKRFIPISSGIALLLFDLMFRYTLKDSLDGTVPGNPALLILQGQDLLNAAKLLAGL